MEVFISWSGKRGEIIAKCVSEILERANHQIRSYVSARVRPGEDWRNLLNEKLRTVDAGIVVVTPESRESDWLHYEAGALRFGNLNRPVLPLCFELGTDELSAPISQLQAKAFTMENMEELVRQLNAMLPDGARRDEIQITRSFAQIWNSEFVAKLPQLSSVRLDYDETFKVLLGSLSVAGFGEMIFTSSYRFESGFEDWNLYQTLFQNAQERLWVLGRKNRKAFDKSFNWFYEAAVNKEKLRSSLRFLFLSPDSPEGVLSAAHKDTDFRLQLQQSIAGATSRLKQNGLVPADHCRTYGAMRNYHVIVCDNAVLYCAVNLDPDGRAQNLTDSPFQITDASSSVGRELVAMVDALWNRSAPFTTPP